MDVVKISSYIDIKDLDNLRSYLDDSLDKKEELQKKVLLSTVNTLLFNQLYKVSPDYSLEIFNRTTDNICVGHYCLEFINDYYSTVDDVPQTRDPNIEAAIRYINHNLDSDLKLETLAEHLGLSKNYFSNLFKEKTGIRFSRYINVQRINKSKRLLKFSGNTMDEIAKRCGFNSQSHFSTTFSKLEDITPTEYRKQVNI